MSGMHTYEYMQPSQKESNMAGESTQKKLTRFRPPRVSISYETTEEGGKKSKHSLPFVIGVMGNYSGHKFKKVKKLKDEQFLSVNKQNFDKVVESVAPELKIQVDNKINNKTEKLNTSVHFKSMADFNPGKLAENVEPLRELMEKRKKLAELQEVINSNDKLEQVLLSLSKNKDALKKFASPESESAHKDKNSEHKS